MQTLQSNKSLLQETCKQKRQRLIVFKFVQEPQNYFKLFLQSKNSGRQELKLIPHNCDKKHIILLFQAKAPTQCKLILAKIINKA